jgi:hypothetical protein
VLVRHLASCERCRDELSGLAALPALLRRPPVQAAAQPSSESAAAHERDAGEALLGRALSRVAAPAGRRALARPEQRRQERRGELRLGAQPGQRSGDSDYQEEVD